MQTITDSKTDPIVSGIRPCKTFRVYRDETRAFGAFTVTLTATNTRVPSRSKKTLAGAQTISSLIVDTAYQDAKSLEDRHGCFMVISNVGCTMGCATLPLVTALITWELAYFPLSFAASFMLAILMLLSWAHYLNSIGEKEFRQANFIYHNLLSYLKMHQEHSPVKEKQLITLIGDQSSEIKINLLFGVDKIVNEIRHDKFKAEDARDAYRNYLLLLGWYLLESGKNVPAVIAALKSMDHHSLLNDLNPLYLEKCTIANFRAFLLMMWWKHSFGQSSNLLPPEITQMITKYAAPCES